MLCAMKSLFLNLSGQTKEGKATAQISFGDGWCTVTVNLTFRVVLRRVLDSKLVSHTWLL